MTKVRQVFVAQKLHHEQAEALCLYVMGFPSWDEDLLGEYDEDAMGDMMEEHQERCAQLTSEAFSVPSWLDACLRGTHGIRVQYLRCSLPQDGVLLLQLLAWLPRELEEEVFQWVSQYSPDNLLGYSLGEGEAFPIFYLHSRYGQPPIKQSQLPSSLTAPMGWWDEEQATDKCSILHARLDGSQHPEAVQFLDMMIHDYPAPAPGMSLHEVLTLRREPLEKAEELVPELPLDERIAWLNALTRCERDQEGATEIILLSPVSGQGDTYEQEWELVILTDLLGDNLSWEALFPWIARLAPRNSSFSFLGLELDTPRWNADPPKMFHARLGEITVLPASGRDELLWEIDAPLGASTAAP